MHRYITKYYEMVKEIKRGGYGIIYEVIEKKTRKKYAAKSFNSLDDSAKSAIKREIEIMMSLQHPAIIQFHCFFLYDFSKKPNYTIIMSLAENGSLADAISLLKKCQADVKFDNTVEQIILIGIASGMMFLHKHGIAHRDLKPANILLDENYHPLIADFGLSKKYNTGKSENSGMRGTTIYIPPEELINDPTAEHSKEKADVYSFGILMYELVTLSTPYPELDQGKITQYAFYSKVINEHYRPTFNVPIEPSLEKLIQRCWSKNLKIRPTFKELFELLSNQDYFLPNVREDDIEDYIDELNGGIQKVSHHKILIPTLNDEKPAPNVMHEIKRRNSLENEEKLKEIITNLTKENEDIKKIALKQQKVINQQKELIADTQQKLSEETTKNQEYEKKVEEQQEIQKQNEIALNDLRNNLNKEILSRNNLEKMHKEETKKQNSTINSLNDKIKNLTNNPNISDSSTVFLKNIPYNINEEDLHQIFRKFGIISHVRIFKNRNNSKKRMGFIKFISKDSAFEAKKNVPNIFPL